MWNTLALILLGVFLVFCCYGMYHSFVYHKTTSIHPSNVDALQIPRLVINVHPYGKRMMWHIEKLHRQTEEQYAEVVVTKLLAKVSGLSKSGYLTTEWPDGAFGEW